MLEGLVANKLSDILSEYLENLNRDDLKISAGDINLRGLTLKASALDAFDLPVSIAHGQLGIFRVTIPWTSLRSSPVRVVISDVYLVVKPRSNDVYDEALERERHQKQKAKHIATYEALKAQRKTAASQQQDEKKTGGWLSYITGSNIVQTVINNLHIQIENVHVRYEDLSDASNPIVFGATIGELSLSTADAQWNKTFLQAGQIGKLIHKLAELKNLSIYGTNRDKLAFSSIARTDEFIRQMKKLDMSRLDSSYYILRPINGSLRVALQKSSDIDLTKPQIKASLRFDDFNLQFDELQYRSLLKVLESVTEVKRFEKFRKMRPTVGLHSKLERQKWWQYFMLSVNMQTKERFFSWNDVVQRKKQREQYMALYKRQQEVPYLPKLDDLGKKDLDNLERDLHYEDIILYRELADAEITVETKNYTEYKKKQEAIMQKKKASQGWFSGWFGSKSSDTDSGSTSNDDDAPLIELTEEARQELYRSIGGDAQASMDQRIAPNDWTNMVFDFSLQKGSFNILDSKSATHITSAVYQKIQFSVALRQDSSAKVDMTLQSFDVTDRFNADTKFPLILFRRANSSHPSSSALSPLVKASVETGSFITTGHDIRVCASLEELNFIVNAPYIQRVLGFFIIPSDIDISSLQNAALDQVSSLQQQASTQLKLALESHKSIDAQITIIAPNVLLPATCDAVENTPMLLADLGQLTFKTSGDPVSRRKRLKNSEQLEEDDFYDRYEMGIKHVKVLLSDYGHWRHEIGWLAHGSNQDLLSDVSLKVEANQRITATDATKPKFKIKAEVPEVSVSISPHRVQKMARILNSLITSGLLDDPTGAMDTQRKKLSAQLQVNGPLKREITTDTDVDRLMTSYWVELRENGTILLKHSSTEKRAIASINLRNARIMNKFEKGSIAQDRIARIKEEISDVQLNLLLGIVIPSQDGSDGSSDQVFFLLFPSPKVRAQWLGVLKESILSFIRPQMILPLSENSLFVDGDDIDNVDDAGIDNEVALLSDDRPMGESRRSPQETSIMASFQLGRFSIVLNDNEKDISKITLSSLRTDFTSRLFDTTIDLRVGSFVVSDISSNRLVLQSGSIGPDMNELINVSFVQANTKDSPLFDVDSAMRVSLKLGAVHFLFDPEIMTQFVRFGYKVQASTAKIKSRIQSFEAIVPNDGNVEHEANGVHASSLKLDASLNKLSLMLMNHDDDEQFMSAAIQGVSASLLNTLQEMRMEASIKTLSVRNLINEIRHKDIISSKTKDMNDLVEFSFRQLKTAHHPVDVKPFYDKFVVAKISSLRFVYLQRQLKHLQEYFTKGILWETIRSADKSKDQTPQQEQLQTKEFVNERLSLDLEVLDTTVHLPVSWRDDDLLAVSLDHIHVNNSLDTIVIKEDNHRETYQVSIRDMGIKSRINGKVQRLSNGINMSTSASMAICGKEIPSLNVEIDASDIELALAHLQYQLIFRIMEGNFGDNGNVPSLQDEEQTSNLVYDAQKVAAKENKAQGNSESKFTIKLPKLCTTLLRGSGELLGKENKLACLKLDGLNISVCTKDDKSMSCKLELDSIDVDDLRAESTSFFKSLISSRQSESNITAAAATAALEDPFFSFSMATVPGGDSTLAIKVADPRITLIPETVHEMAEFFTTQTTARSDGPKPATVSEHPISSDFHFSQEQEFLGEDIMLDIHRRLVIGSNEHDIVVINGEGHTIHFDSSSSNEPLVTIPDGMVLQFKNIKLHYVNDLADLVSMGENAKILDSVSDEVIHVQTNGEEFKKRLASRDKDGTEAKPKFSEESARNAKKITFSGSFGSPSLIIPEDSSDPNTRLFVIRAALDVHYHRDHCSEEGHFSIKSLEAFAEDNRTGIRGAPIIDVSGVSVDLTTPNTHDTILERTIKLNMDQRLKLRLSYQDAKMISNITSNLKTSTSKEETQTFLERQLKEHGLDYHYDDDEDLSLNQEPQVLALYDTSDDDESDHDTDESGAFHDAIEEEKSSDHDIISTESSNATVQQASTAAAPSTSEVQSTVFHLSFKSQSGISLLIVDDLKGWDVPLLDVHITNVVLKDGYFNSKNGEFRACLNTCLKGRYYNVTLADYEPIIEPFSIIINASYLSSLRSQDPDAKILSAELCVIEPQENFNINISRIMMNSINSTLRMWREDLKRSTKSVSLRFDPFVVRNHSGHMLRFWRLENETQQKQQWTLQSDEYQGVSFGDQHASASARYGVVIEIDGFPPVKINDARRVETYAVSSLRDRKLVCVVAVTESEGRKFITARSGFIVQNDTSVPIEVGIVQRLVMATDQKTSDSQMSPNVVSIGVVEPKSNKGVPIIDDLSNTYLCMRPRTSADSIENQWSRILDSASFQNIMRLDSTQHFECKPLHGGSHSFFVAAIVSSDDSFSASVRSKLAQTNSWHKLQRLNYCIRLIPPLCVSNLLGLDMRFSVLGKRALSDKGTTSVCDEILLKNGDMQYIYAADPSQNLLMRAMPAGDSQNKWTHTNELALISSNEHPIQKPLTTRIPVRDDRKNTLHLHIDHEFNTCAFRHVTVFVPYWIVNHSGKPIQVYDGEHSAAGNHFFASMNPAETQGDSLRTTVMEPLPFSFISPSKGSKIKIASGVHKTKQTIDLVAATIPQAVDLQDTTDPRSSNTKAPAQLTVSVSLAPGKFNRTLIAKISSRYVVVNLLDTPVEFRQSDESSHSRLVQPTQRQNLYMWHRQDRHFELQFRKKPLSSPSSWSSKFRLDRLGDIPLKLDSSGVNVNLQENDGVVFVIVEALSNPPYIVRNRTNFELQFSQTGCKTWRTVEPQSSVDYWWDDASNPSPTISCKIGAHLVDTIISPDAATAKPASLTSLNEKYVYYTVEQQGPSRIVQFFARNSSMDKEDDDTCKRGELTVAISVRIPKIGISLVDMPMNEMPEELLFISLDELTIQFNQTTKNYFGNLMVKALQIDNQMHNAHYPVLLAMTQAPLDTNPQPMINLSFDMRIMDKSDSSSLFILPMLDLAVQEFDINLTSDLIIKLQRYFSTLTTSTTDEEDHMIDVTTESVRHNDRKQRVYLGEFKLHPLHFHLTFKTTDVLSEEFRKNPLFLALNQGVGSIINIDDVDLKFNLMQLDNHFSTLQELQSRITQHYIRDFLLQVFKVLLSLEALGNPIGLAKGIGTGVRDLFYEPANAVVKNPMGLTGAVIKGTSSFGSKAVQGSANSASKVGGTIGKALGALSFDEEYVNEREKTSRKKASNVKEGITDGIGSLSRGVIGGATGLFSNPIKGASRQGIGGFVKGLGKGIIGVPVKPIAGVVDLVAKTTEGISNQGKEQKQRRRFPRAFRQDGAVVRYDHNRSMMEDILRDNISDERLVSYCVSNAQQQQQQSSEVVMLGRFAAYSVNIATRRILWTVKYDQITNISLADEISSGQPRAVMITHLQSKSSQQSTRRVYNEKDSNELQQFHSKLKELVAREVAANILSD